MLSIRHRFHIQRQINWKIGKDRSCRKQPPPDKINCNVNLKTIEKKKGILNAERIHRAGHVVYAYNPGTLDVETRQSSVSSKPELHSKTALNTNTQSMHKKI